MSLCHGPHGWLACVPAVLTGELQHLQLLSRGGPVQHTACGQMIPPPLPLPNPAITIKIQRLSIVTTNNEKLKKKTVI